MVHKSGYEQKHAVIVLSCRFHRLCCGAEEAIRLCYELKCIFVLAASFFATIWRAVLPWRCSICIKTRHLGDAFGASSLCCNHIEWWYVFFCNSHMNDILVFRINLQHNAHCIFASFCSSFVCNIQIQMES